MQQAEVWSCFRIPMVPGRSFVGYRLSAARLEGEDGNVVDGGSLSVNIDCRDAIHRQDRDIRRCKHEVPMETASANRIRREHR